MVIGYNPSHSNINSEVNAPFKILSLLVRLLENEISPKIVEYLKDPLTQNEINQLVKKLGKNPMEIVRKKEEVFKSLDLDQTDDQAVTKAIAENPTILERPIVVHGDRAVVGRPPSNVLDLIK